MADQKKLVAEITSMDEDFIWTPASRQSALKMCIFP